MRRFERPGFALEVAVQHTCLVAAVCACRRACRVASGFPQPGAARGNANADIVGVEVGGAVKNVMVVPIEPVRWPGPGSERPRCLAHPGVGEMTRLGVALGPRSETFMGLSGMGDFSNDGHRRLFAQPQGGPAALAQGLSQRPPCNRWAMWPKGCTAPRTVVQRAQALGVEMPIAMAVVQLLDGTASPQRVLHALMGRDPGSMCKERAASAFK